MKGTDNMKLFVKYSDDSYPEFSLDFKINLKDPCEDATLSIANQVEGQELEYDVYTGNNPQTFFFNLLSLISSSETIRNTCGGFQV